MTTPLQHRNIKVLLAKMGLDGHDRGVKAIARAFRDSGMEVVYLGMRVTADQIAQATLQEDADVVGISILSGAHMRLVPRLAQALTDKGIMDDVLLLVGGTIPDQDVEPLQQIGVHGVFPVGAFTGEMVDFIQANVKSGKSSPAQHQAEDLQPANPTGGVVPRQGMGDCLMDQWPPQYPTDYVPAEDSEYWSERLETMPSRERDPIILDKLRRQINYACNHSQFYRELYRDAPVDPTNIRSFEDLAQLPILTKEHIRAEQEAHPRMDVSCASTRTTCTASTGRRAPPAAPPSSGSAAATGSGLPRPTPASCGASAYARRTA